MVHPIIMLLSTVLEVYIFVVIVWIVLSWLIAFNIVNRYQPLVQRVDYALGRLVEPVVKRIRRYMPELGGIDISPVILLILLNFLNYALYYYFV